MSTATPSSPGAGHSPWRWVPSLYFAQGIPYAMVTVVSVVMFKRLGMDNARVAFYTSLLGLPWVLKPLWSPVVQATGSRRNWTLAMQLFVAAGLAAAAFMLPTAGWVRFVLIAYALVAVASATHDVAADGLYLQSLSSHQQAWFVGIRNTSYRLAMIFANGVLVVLAGSLESNTGLPTVSVNVSAASRPADTLPVEPGSIRPIEIGADGAPQASSIQLSLAGRGADDARTYIQQVRTWNVDRGFYQPPAESRATEPKSSAIQALESWISARFGPRRATADAGRAGDVALVAMQLAPAARQGDEQIVQLGLASGDSAFKIVEGDRFTVTPRNWNEPFYAVVQADQTLDHPSSAEFQIRTGNIPLAWMVTLLVAAALFAALCAYHLAALPRSVHDVAVRRARSRVMDFVEPFAAFFRKPRILALLAFLLLYRLPEAQLIKLAAPFLVDPRDKGGLALTTSEYGVVYGTVGVVMLLLGGIVGGMMAARHGLRAWLWPMALAIHLPNTAFLLMAYLQPESRWVITAAVGVEQFGYGFGFTAYMLYCIYIARGEHQTVHYALCTGFMALGMLVPGMWSGWLQKLIGYEHFFVWVMICMIPSLLAVAFIPLDRQFGKKAPEEAR